LRSEEVRLTEAPQEIPKYILGDTIELCIYLRHRKNIERVEAVFAPRTETEPDAPIVFEGTPQPWRREGDDRISRVEFYAEVAADWVHDDYVCSSLVAYYPATRATSQNRGDQLGIPEDLRFKIVAEPRETPAVEGWHWGSQP
jgi:hypothetical protein